MANSVPTLTGLTTPVTFLENTVNAAPQIIDADVTFTDPDNNFNGGTLTVSGLLAEDTVAIRNQGTGAGEIGVSGSNVTFGGIVIGSFAGGAGSTLTVTFNAAATAAAIEALIENLTYANSSDTPTASRRLELKVTDAAGFAAIAPIGSRSRPAPPIRSTASMWAHSSASFGDLDGDGDLDAVVGDDRGTSALFREHRHGHRAGLQPSRPAPPIRSTASMCGIYSAPTFADLDGDGDLDAVVGDNDGTLHYFENTGTAIAPAFTEQTGAANPFNGIDVGYYSAPTFADLDGDGDLDAVVGEFDGILHYFENTGTAPAPAFTERTGAANPFDGIDVGDLQRAELRRPRRRRRPRRGRRGRRRHPALFREHRLGHRAGLHRADRRRQSVQRRRCGDFSAPSFADLDGDGDLDAVVGEVVGNLQLFREHRPGFDAGGQRDGGERRADRFPTTCAI